MLISILLVIFILSVLVLIHEMGHFLVAKFHGIRVEEFGLGLPPKIIGFKRKGDETEYSLNLLPFGGFVRLTGEDALNPDTADMHNFMSKTPWQRISVLIAGVVMNLLLAFTLFYVFFAFHGFKSGTIPLIFDYTFKYGHTNRTNLLVADLVENYPAANSGMHVGDVIKDIDGVELGSVKDIQDYLQQRGEVPVILGYIDFETDNYMQRAVVPAKSPDGRLSLGVYLSPAVVLDYGTTPLSRILAAPQHSCNILAYSFHGMQELLTISLQQRDVRPVSESVAGPVGLFKIVSTILHFGGAKAFWLLLDFLALLSLSLAILNILPLPALDGGRVVFVLLEVFLHRKVNPKLEATFHQAGMMFFLLLMLVVTLKDIFLK